MKYIVSGSLTVSCWTEVEADSKEDALDIAMNRDTGTLCHSALYPEVDECFHFEDDGMPFNLTVEDD